MVKIIIIVLGDETNTHLTENFVILTWDFLFGVKTYNMSIKHYTYITIIANSNCYSFKFWILRCR